MSAIFLTTKKSSRAGVTLVEMVIYVLLLTFITGIIVQMLVAVGGVYRNIKLTRELESSGTIVMENILRESRNASSVVVDDSVLGTSPGILKIAGIDESGANYTIVYDVFSAAVRISKDGEPPVALTSSSITVSSLIFRNVNSGNSEGVRIELEVSEVAGLVSKSKKFYGFTVLRGSY